MRFLLIAALLALPVTAQAHDPLHLTAAYDPDIIWLDQPESDNLGQARIRMIYHGRERAALLTTNQTWIYTEAYRKHLTRLTRHMSVHRAIPRARHAAFHAVVQSYPNVTVTEAKLDPTRGPRWVVD